MRSVDETADVPDLLEVDSSSADPKASKENSSIPKCSLN